MFRTRSFPVPIPDFLSEGAVRTRAEVAEELLTSQNPKFSFKAEVSYGGNIYEPKLLSECPLQRKHLKNKHSSILIKGNETEVTLMWKLLPEEEDAKIRIHISSSKDSALLKEDEEFQTSLLADSSQKTLVFYHPYDCMAKKLVDLTKGLPITMVQPVRENITFSTRLIIIDQDGRILLTRKRCNEECQPGWGIPGKGTNLSQNFLESQANNLEEEIGLNIKTFFRDFPHFGTLSKDKARNFKDFFLYENTSDRNHEQSLSIAHHEFILYSMLQIDLPAMVTYPEPSQLIRKDLYQDSKKHTQAEATDKRISHYNYLTEAARVRGELNPEGARFKPKRALKDKIEKEYKKHIKESIKPELSKDCTADAFAWIHFEQLNALIRSNPKYALTLAPSEETKEPALEEAYPEILESSFNFYIFKDDKETCERGSFKKLYPDYPNKFTGEGILREDVPAILMLISNLNGTRDFKALHT
ncbi:unnamed protein product [Moneuplotes crassus]|uniref:Nudix hydrolase domain-containing protein n=1 Tax=Euplotes crassus TaxID=5936 RepID=A0AAD1Y7Z6_EUPCR|nr:unnamed protein product [Moneuplotes crassus]